MSGDTLFPGATREELPATLGGFLIFSVPSESVDNSQVILVTENVYVVQYVLFRWSVLPVRRRVPSRVHDTRLVRSR